MNKVRGLVKELLSQPTDELEHQQTVRITELAHQQLIELARYVGRSKSSLASDLLVAAIQDAIDSLPDEPTDRFHINAESVSPRTFISTIAQHNYDEILAAEGIGSTVDSDHVHLGGAYRRLEDAA